MLKKISELTATNELDDNSLFVVVHEEETKKINKSNVKKAIVGDLSEQVETIEEDLYGEITKSVTTGETTLNNTVKDRDLSIPQLEGHTKQESTNGYNILKLKATEVKSYNTSGTWNENEYTLTGVKFKLYIDDNGVVTKVEISGTSTTQTTFYLFNGNNYLASGDYLLSGCTNGSNTTYDLRSFNTNGTNEVKQNFTTPVSLTSNGGTQGINIAIIVRNAQTISNVSISPMLESGSTAHNWEKYTGGIPAPNPSYPFPINSTTGNNTVTERGINLCNLNVTQNSKVTVNSDGTITIDGSGGFALNFASTTLQAGKTYIQKYEVISGTITNSTNIFQTFGSTWLTPTNPSATYTPASNETKNSTWINNSATFTNCKLRIWFEKDNTAHNFTPYITPITKQLNLGDIELNEINTTKDVIFKNNPKSDLYQSNLDLDAWYVLNRIPEITYTGAESESWNYNSTTHSFVKYNPFSIINKEDYASGTKLPEILSNYYTPVKFNDFLNGNIGLTLYYANGTLQMRLSSDETTEANFKTWLSTHNVKIKYIGATPTYTKITDTTLISQLEAIQTLKQLQGTTVIEIDDIMNFKVVYDGNRIEQIQADLLSKQNITDNTLQTTNKTIPTAINEVNSIAKGANQAISYSNYSAMITAINAMSNTALNVGQNIYIITLDVPDLWISSIESTSSTYTYTTDEAFITALETNGYVQVGYYKLSALETQKVDLTTYVEFTDEASASTAGVIKISILTQAQYDALVSGGTVDSSVYYFIEEE